MKKTYLLLHFLFLFQLHTHAAVESLALVHQTRDEKGFRRSVDPNEGKR